MKKSDFISLLSQNLEDYNELDISLSADLIQKVIIESLRKRYRVEIRGFGSFALGIGNLSELEIQKQVSQ